MITSPISPGATAPGFEKQNAFALISNTYACEFSHQTYTAAAAIVSHIIIRT